MIVIECREESQNSPKNYAQGTCKNVLLFIMKYMPLRREPKRETLWISYGGTGKSERKIFGHQFVWGSLISFSRHSIRSKASVSHDSLFGSSFTHWTQVHSYQSLILRWELHSCIIPDQKLSTLHAEITHSLFRRNLHINAWMLGYQKCSPLFFLSLTLFSMWQTEKRDRTERTEYQEKVIRWLFCQAEWDKQADSSFSLFFRLSFPLTVRTLFSSSFNGRTNFFLWKTHLLSACQLSHPSIFTGKIRFLLVKLWKQKWQARYWAHSVHNLWLSVCSFSFSLHEIQWHEKRKLSPVSEGRRRESMNSRTLSLILLLWADQTERKESWGGEERRRGLNDIWTKASSLHTSTSLPYLIHTCCCSLYSWGRKKEMFQCMCADLR